VVPAGKPNSIEGTHTYQYDAFGRRVAKAVGGATPSTTVYVSKTAGLPNSPYAAQELAEYGLGVAATNPVRKYAYGRYIDDLLLFVERSAAGDAGSGIDEKLYVHTDRRFSVTALTNSTGGVAERYSYTPYGEIAVFDGAGVVRGGSFYGLSVAYTGRKLDRESGLYFFRARYHDPRLGRFTTRDPLFYPDGPNAYAAWMGVKGVDPDGKYSYSPNGWNTIGETGNNGQSLVVSSSCNGTQAQSIRSAHQQACDCLNKAAKLLSDHGDKVSKYFATRRGDTEELLTESGRSRLLQQVQSAQRGCTGQKALRVFCPCSCDQGTDAYVIFLTFTNIVIGDGINLCPGWFTTRGADPGVLLHEMGRYFNSMGESMTGTVHDVYPWDNKLRSLCTQYDEILLD
jgi:RHS repeat-associated protein